MSCFTTYLRKITYEIGITGNGIPDSLLFVNLPQGYYSVFSFSFGILFHIPFVWAKGSEPLKLHETITYLIEDFIE